jgi:GTP-binding protein
VAKNTVAIMGRPNVGKSTLFNRIVKKREAIVDSTPGVTRDRIYMTTEWAGVSFELIDTGGYVPLSKDVFEQAIREQAAYAINEADVILFVTDVISGVTPLDEEIAAILQKSGRKVILVANKVDHDGRLADLVDFYRLGIGDPQPVSAINGLMIGDLLDRIVGALPGNSETSREKSEINLAVLGRPNVGKSSYINALLGEHRHIVTEIPGTTRDAIDTLIHYKKQAITLIDTAGLRKKTHIKEDVEYYSTVRTHRAIHRCDVAIVLIDATEGLTDQDKRILASAADEGKGIVLGVNKWDLVKKDTMTARRFEITIQKEIPSLSFVPVMFISCLTKQRVFRLLDVALSVYTERNRQFKTADLNRFLEEMLNKNSPPAYGRKFVKINYVTQTRVAPPVFTFFTNEPKGIKKNYKNYIENQLRSQYGFMGVPLRIKFTKKN